MAGVTPEIVQIPVAGTDNFSYLVICKESGKALAIDPGASAKSLLDELRRRELRLELLANTHGHHDHIAANAEVLAETGALLAASLLDV
ncbi:MAG: MBL fold metallo-hydrolase, partial [Desulfuromonadales bacterium]|nr:MBL fold metallo-hydrolase [Desulfuromonadales bacterium]